MRSMLGSSKLRWLGFIGAVVLVASFVLLPRSGVARAGIIQQAVSGKLRSAQFRTPAGVRRALPGLSAGTLGAAQHAAADADEERPFQDEREEAADAATGVDPAIIGYSDESAGCGNRTSGSDVRVNQDCGFRRQAETLIKANPINKKNLIAGQNDSRIGYNHCGFDYSFDGGETWGDGIPPTFQRLNTPTVGGVNSIAGDEGTFHTYDAASDPALAFDSQGRAFYSCILFDVASNASGLYVTASPVQAGGSFYNNIPPTGNKYMVVEDNSPVYFHDKNFITADSFKNSPYHDNVYVTWTLFKSNCGTDQASYCSSTIYFSKSTDHAATWSKPVEISGNSPSLCFFGNALDPTSDEHDCNFNQGSDPVVLPDGTIVVVFNNGNTPEGNPNGQQLAVYSKDGGATWGKPVKVGDDVFSGAPQCDFGRGPEQCIPGAYIRTNDFPRIAVDKKNGDVYSVWQDYRHGEYDIVLSRSTDNGKTWKEATDRVNRSTGRDHYFPAVDVGDNHAVAVAYYRTGRIPNENTTPEDGFTPGRDAGVQDRLSDVYLAGGEVLDTPYHTTRIAKSFPPPDGNQAGFNGDYMGIVAIGDEALPFWSDTRNAALTDQGVIHDEDVFVDRKSIPGT